MKLGSGTSVPLTTGQLVVGSRFRFILEVTKTAAGTSPWTLRVAYGTHDTASQDAAIATWTSGTNTALADRALLIIDVRITAVGASGTATCVAFWINQATDSTGLGSIGGAPTAAALDTTVASPFLHVDISPGSSAVMTAGGAAEQLN